MWVALILASLVAGVGIRVLSPAARLSAIEEVNARQDRAIEQLTMFVKAIAIGQCLDRPEREIQLMGLPCDTLLRGRMR
jgi:type II secretory pathway component PulJ